MRFPPERELNLNKDGNGEHNNMEVGTVNDLLWNSLGLVTGTM